MKKTTTIKKAFNIFKKNLSAIVFGFLLFSFMVFLLEIFFFFNSKYKFIKPFTYNYQWKKFSERLPVSESTDIINRIDLSYTKNLEQVEPNYLFQHGNIVYEVNENENNDGFWRKFRQKVYFPKNDIVVYDFEYKVDTFGRRITLPINNKSTQNMIFLGCSFTFGEGVSDSDTFPSLIAKKLKNYHVYNTGRQGDGPNDILAAIINNEPRLDGINKTSGITLYTLIPHHFLRLFGTAQFLKQDPNWKLKPYIKNTSNGPILNGSFITGRFFKSKLYQLIGQSNIFNYFDLDFPVIGKEEIVFFAKIVNEIKIRSIKKFGTKEFFTVFFPGEMHFILPFLKSELEKLDIPVLDYSGIPTAKILKGNHTFINNPHASSLAYRLFADLLYADLKTRKIIE